MNWRKGRKALKKQPENLRQSSDGKPEKLFEATCGHVGYVAAGLAVCWQPHGQRLDYVEQAGTRQHRVVAYDVTTRKTEETSLPLAENVALDSSPGRPYRAALLGGAGGQSGLWVEAAASHRWWLVPDSAPETAHLEELRRQLPRWSRDGTRLAFAARTDVRVGDVATHRTETWHHFEPPKADLTFRSSQSQTDLHWHPDGTRIGLVDGSRLLLVGPGGQARQLTAGPVVSFAGWDGSGKRMAYVTAEPLPYETGATWATLFVPNPNARTAVQVALADGSNSRTLISDVRATFPHWSPADHRLSVWLTVEPPYRLAAEGRLGMRPGDPAALIDPDTGKLEWLPVSGTEHAQIGHVDLRAGRLDAALHRFDEAAAALPADGTADWMFFRAIALQKAGRPAEAANTLRRFALPDTPEQERLQSPTTSQMAVIGARWPMADREVIRSRHRFVAEAYVSLDGATDGIDFFRRELKEARSDRDRLSATVVLCQLLLLADRRAEYAELVADYLVPLTGQVLPGSGPDRDAIGGAVAMTLLPLGSSEFTSGLPEKAIRKVSEKVAAWPKGEDDLDFACQLALRACSRRLQDAALVEKATMRLASHPARVRWNLAPGDEVTLEVLMRIRLTFLLPELLREAFGELPSPQVR